MATVPGDTCDLCHKPYPFRKGVDKLNCYLLFPAYNHIHATCPHCKATTRIFVDVDQFIAVLPVVMVILFYKTVGLDVVDDYNTVLGRMAAVETDVSLGDLLPRQERTVEFFMYELDHWDGSETI